MIKKKSSCFPIHYRDTPFNDGHRLSNKIVEVVETVVETKRFQNICSALISTALIIGGQAQVSNAIPPEVSEYIANVADAAVDAEKVADLAPNIGGRVADAVANVGDIPPIGNQNPIPVKDLPIAKVGLPGGQPLPGQPPVYMPLGRPITPVGRTTNTIMFIGSIGWVCVNAYWGNPVAIAGCSVMLVTWLGTALGVKVR